MPYVTLRHYNLPHISSANDLFDTLKEVTVHQLVNQNIECFHGTAASFRLVAVRDIPLQNYF